MNKELISFLDRKVTEYNNPDFIKSDPICIPHRFTQKADIEIAGFFAAIFAWGNRTIIIKKATELLQRMDNAPYDFCLNSQPADLKKLLNFKHRTFNDTDLLYFIDFFKHHYSRFPTLETAFTQWLNPADDDITASLNGFYNYFFSLEHVPDHTRKHIAMPHKGSTCKRLNMFLRWMVRCDKQGVDLGIWKNINPSQLICPIDVHVARVARHFNLLQRNQTDWLAAIELTDYLRMLDKKDPVKYDFALFGLGVMEKFG